MARPVGGEAPGDVAGAARDGTTLFLAPHYDDVALSCGGTVAALADVGARPIVVTIFGGEPAPDDLSAFARGQHDRWGTGAGDTVATRLAEDRSAAAILGCDTRVLPFLDAIYRGDQYRSDDALFGPVAPADAPLVAAIAAEVAALAGPGATVHVPLGVGNHVDHQIVYRVGRMLAARGWRALAYEDFPYAALDGATARRLEAVAGEVGPPEAVPVAATLSRRIAAIAAYRSQLPTIFRFTDDWPALVARAAAEAGGGAGAVERFRPLIVPTGMG